MSVRLQSLIVTLLGAFASPRSANRNRFVRPSPIRLYACSNSRTTERIFIKFRIGHFYKKKIVKPFQFRLKLNMKTCVRFFARKWLGLSLWLGNSSAIYKGQKSGNSRLGNPQPGNSKVIHTGQRSWNSRVWNPQPRNSRPFTKVRNRGVPAWGIPNIHICQRSGNSLVWNPQMGYSRPFTKIKVLEFPRWESPAGE
jgi:hypothetical protein